MLRNGKQFLAGLRDGRTVYVGGHRVDDVVVHPAFRGAARTLARLFDYKADPGNSDLMSFEEKGERYSTYFLKPETREDLARRSRAHYAIADQNYGLIGRSPDHVASFVTGLAMNPEILDRDGDSFSSNITAYYEHLRNNDLYATYAVHPAPQSKNEALFGDTKGRQAVLQVVDEDQQGITLNGMKMLATAGVFCDEDWGFVLVHVQTYMRGDIFFHWSASWFLQIAALRALHVARHATRATYGNGGRPLSIRTLLPAAQHSCKNAAKGHNV